MQSIFGFTNGTTHGVLLYINAGKLAGNRFVDPTFQIVSSVANLTVGAWNHVALVVGATQRVWLNGVGSTTITPSVSPVVNQFLIGTRRVSGALADYGNGRIAEAGVWNTALSDEEILSMSKGYKCRTVRANGLISDLRLIRNLQDFSLGGVVTSTNSPTVSEHARIIYP